MKNKFLAFFSVAVLSLGTSCIFAATGTETLDVPGWNGSTYSTDGVSKDRDDSKASFKAISRSSSFGMDARVVNSDEVSRSSWARNMNPGVLIKVSTTAEKGHAYYTEVSSDFYEPNTNSISFKWSPDTEDLN